MKLWDNMGDENTKKCDSGFMIYSTLSVSR